LSRARSSDGDAREDNRHSELEELAAFGAALEELRRQCQLSYRSLSEKVGYSSSVLAKAASGRERPTLEVVRAFVSACGGDLPDWIGRWHTMSAAVDHHHRELQAMVDMPYEIMACPDSPARFNRQLQLRVCRAGKQAGVVLRANYAPSTASGVFKSTRLANEEFVRRILVAANAPSDEQATWLEWRRQLARTPRPTPSQATTVTPARRPVWLRRASAVLVAAGAIVAVGLTSAALMPEPSSGMRLDAGLRSPAANAPWQDPTPKVSSSTAGHGVGPSAGVPTVGGTPSPEGLSVGTTPTPPVAATQDGVRMWKATIVSDQAQIDGAPANLGGTTPIQPGDTVYIVCITTKTKPTGWYYTDRGGYLDPAIVRFVSNDVDAIPPCIKVPFPEIGMTPMPNDPTYSRDTRKRHSDKG
jgi:transcriptional regulator with XRE-family HTH domain